MGKLDCRDEHIYQLHYPQLSKRRDYTNCIFLQRSEVMSKTECIRTLRAYRNLIITENAGYKMVCTTNIYTVSELRFNTKTLVVRRRDIDERPVKRVIALRSLNW